MIPAKIPILFICHKTPRDSSAAVDLNRVFLVLDLWNRSTKIGVVQSCTMVPRPRTSTPKIWICRKTGWELPWNKIGRRRKTFTKGSRNLNLIRNLKLSKTSAEEQTITSLWLPLQDYKGKIYSVKIRYFKTLRHWCSKLSLNQA